MRNQYAKLLASDSYSAGEVGYLSGDIDVRSVRKYSQDRKAAGNVTTDTPVLAQETIKAGDKGLFLLEGYTIHGVPSEARHLDVLKLWRNGSTTASFYDKLVVAHDESDAYLANSNIECITVGNGAMWFGTKSAGTAQKEYDIYVVNQVTVGKVVYKLANGGLHTGAPDEVWDLADNSNETKSKGDLLVVINDAPANSMTRGVSVDPDVGYTISGASCGDIGYLSTNGDLTTTAPSTSNYIVRKICVANVSGISVNIDPSWGKLA